MSCHSIGHGINTITHKLSELYDENKLSQEDFKELLKICQKAVWFCDGNPPEAIYCVIGKDCMANRDIDPVIRCGSCLKIMENEDAIENLFDAYNEKPDVKKQYGHPYYSCIDCYNKYLKQYDYKYKFVKIEDGEIIK
ncbi:MAG: hypothetical protein IKP12_01485 [Acholeplasmatales bacterium]|nr:hypothetical protein [Acholeplasmatales bacterium]